MQGDWPNIGLDETWSAGTETGGSPVQIRPGGFIFYSFIRVICMEEEEWEEWEEEEWEEWEEEEWEEEW